jgi:hypothetical protein
MKLQNATPGIMGNKTYQMEIHSTSKISRLNNHQLPLYKNSYNLASNILLYIRALQ